MFSAFRYETIPLKDILLDDENPRIVTQSKLKSQQEILQYLFEYEDLAAFVKKIAAEGRNPGAERPYVVEENSKYVVIEGNTRIAAYKLLTGLLDPPADYADSIPDLSARVKTALLDVACSIAPNRDALLPIMASAHFGLGDKSKWGYLGSRKAVFDKWKAGKSIAQLAKAFDRTQGQIKELILEYLLYQKALSLPWTREEKKALLKPSVEFNPPVRFLQTSGHKSQVGIVYDNTNLKISFVDSEAEKKFKHLLKKLVVNPERGLGATATYDQVFADYAGRGGTKSGGKSTTQSASTSKQTSTGSAGKTSGSSSSSSPKAGSLFSYPVSLNSALVVQLMKEAKEINCKKYPASATFLLRNIVESILKDIIHQQKANAASKTLDLEAALNLCASNNVSLPAPDKKVLKQFQKNYLDYLNLGAHGNIIPNHDMVYAARDFIDPFVKKYV
jgi:hypothetical protein